MFNRLKKITVFAISVMMIFCFCACGNDSFEEKGDYLSGNKWSGSEGVLLDLKDDGTFMFYQKEENKSDNYYSGSFQVLNGQDAIAYMTEEYEFSEESQRTAMNQFNISDEFYYVLVLNNEECIVNGENTLKEKNKSEYFGYYMADNEYLNLTSLQTMAQIDFYKK